MRTTPTSLLRKSGHPPRPGRYTPPTARDRTAFRALQDFAGADGVTLATRVNTAVMFTTGLIAAPYGMGEDADERRRIQREVRQWLEHIQTGRTATLLVREGVNGFRLSYASIAPRRPRVMIWGWNATGLGRFWLDVAALMVRVAPAIRSCAQCRRIFLRSKRQLYCTSRCSQVARSAKWYRAHRPTLRRKRRETYVAAVRRQQPRARVASRSVN